MPYYQIKTDDKGFEYKRYKDPNFPFFCSTTRLSGYRDNNFTCHWHDEPELTLILEGEMEYQVNDQVFHLREGMGIFANANVLHAGWNEHNEDCTYSPLCFRTSLISGNENSTMEKKYVDPVSEHLPYLVLDPVTPNGKAILDLAHKIREISYQRDCDSAELVIKSHFCLLWELLYQESKRSMERQELTPTRGIRQIKNAIAFMDDRYAEKLTLEQIAASCNLSKSEFCRSFKRIARQTPFEYLTRLRIRKSLDLLSRTGLSIQQVAEATGFSSSSYFSETFRRYIQCSPSEYLKKQKLETP